MLKRFATGIFTAVICVIVFSACSSVPVPDVPPIIERIEAADITAASYDGSDAVEVETKLVKFAVKNFSDESDKAYYNNALKRAKGGMVALTPIELYGILVGGGKNVTEEEIAADLERNAGNTITLDYKGDGETVMRGAE